MKILILITTLIFSLTATAEDGFFGPGQIGCGSGTCKSMQIPGSANLANNKGVLNTRTSGKKPKKAPAAGTAPVSK